MRERLLALALEVPELSPRELAVRFTDQEKYFVSEASVYRLLKAHDLITSPAFIVMKAAEAFTEQTTAPNQLWQTDFTYLKVIGWGWFYLSTILDDYSRFIVAWKLCTTMRAGDVTDTLELALAASGCDTARGRPPAPAAQRQRRVLRRRRSRPVARGQGHRPHPRRAEPPADPGQDRALAPEATTSLLRRSTPRLRQLREEQAGQCLADTDDAEQQVASAAQLGLLVDRLGNGLIDGLELRGEVRRRAVSSPRPLPSRQVE